MKAKTKNDYIRKLKKKNPNVRCVVLKKKRKKGNIYAIYSRLKR